MVRDSKLQQYLPFTVLKLAIYSKNEEEAYVIVATVLTVYGIETHKVSIPCTLILRCNSTYRLRY